VPARDAMLREATQIQTRVAGTAKMWTGEDTPSPALLQLLLADGFEAAADKPGKWVKGDAVRVPWRLVSDHVEGILTMSLTKDGHGAVGIKLELDSVAFPSMFRPIAREAVGNFSIPIPTMGFKYGGLAVGFFAYVDLSEEPASSRKFVIRLGGKFEFTVGISLLPDALTKPFPQPLPIIFSHDFSEPIASAASAVEAGIQVVASGAGAVPAAGGASPAANFGLGAAAAASAAHAAKFGSGIYSGAAAMLAGTGHAAGAAGKTSAGSGV
jgi:hypothetical protein